MPNKTRTNIKSPGAKIVCTIGPACSKVSQLKQLMKAGVNVVRINMSHGSYESHLQEFQAIRQADKELNDNVGILVDLQGPKIRLGNFEKSAVSSQENSSNGFVCLKKGQEWKIITDESKLGNSSFGTTTLKTLPKEVKPGEKILIDDGKIELVVISIPSSTEIITKVKVGGIVSDHKGINLPGTAVNVPALSEKDTQDLRWALKTGVDIIALSFVRFAKDIEPVKEIMRQENIFLPVIAKIEKPQAVDNLDAIISAFDGIMVARGDLGVELPLQKVPLVQKDIISQARGRGKPVIVATQILESMIEHHSPTRAEVSDCANAVLDGADALMLSGETAVGKYPVLSVKNMRKIIDDVLSGVNKEKIQPISHKLFTRSGIVTRAGVNMANAIKAKHIVAFTQTGDCAHRISRHKPKMPILAMTTQDKTRRFLALSWGVNAILVNFANTVDEQIVECDSILEQMNFVNKEDTIVIVSGAPINVSGTINQILIHRIGEYDDIA